MIKPSKVKITPVEKKKDFGRFVIEPLPQGYGTTLGNALRRVLLSSFPGAAVTQVKIDGIKHEFSTIKGMKEDIVEFILNVKNLRMRLFADKPVLLKLEVNGPKEVRARDIEAPPEVEITNQGLVLATLADEKSKLKVEFLVEKGVGYSLAEEREISEIGVLPVDAIFTPILRVNYKVEDTRVGRVTNLDKLTLEIKTDEAISPLEALKEAAKTLVDYFIIFYQPPVGEEKEEEKKEAERKEELDLLVEELDLPTRVANSLKKAGVLTAKDLTEKTRLDLSKIKNLGFKSIDEIEKRLGEKGLEFKNEETASEKKRRAKKKKAKSKK